MPGILASGPLVLRTEGVRLSARPDPSGHFETDLLPIQTLYRDDGYGGCYEIPIDMDMCQQALANFAREPRKRIQVDYDHMFFQSEAAGWTYQMWYDQALNMLRCSGNLLPGGAMKVMGDELPYVSPHIIFNATNRRTGKPMGMRIAAVALTADPFLDWMQPVMMSSRATAGYITHMAARAADGGEGRRVFLFNASAYPRQDLVTRYLEEQGAEGGALAAEAAAAAGDGHTAGLGTVPTSVPKAGETKTEGTTTMTLAERWAALPAAVRHCFTYEALYAATPAEDIAQYADTIKAELAALPDTAFAMCDGEGEAKARHYPLRGADGKAVPVLVAYAAEYSAKVATHAVPAKDAIHAAAREAGVQLEGAVPVKPAAPAKAAPAVQYARADVAVVALTSKFCDTNPEDDLDMKTVEAALAELNHQYAVALGAKEGEDPLARARAMGRRMQEKLTGRPVAGELYDSLNGQLAAAEAFNADLQAQVKAQDAEAAKKDKAQATKDLINAALAARKLTRAEALDADIITLADQHPSVFTNWYKKREFVVDDVAAGAAVTGGEHDPIAIEVGFSGAPSGAGFSTPDGANHPFMRRIDQIKAQHPELKFDACEKLAREQYGREAAAYDMATTRKSEKGSNHVINMVGN